jgi:hypothetical protein
MAANRYEKYSIENIRENPKDDMELQLAESDAEVLAGQIMDHLGSGPNFRRRVIRKINERELKTAKKELSRLQDTLGNDLS